MTIQLTEFVDVSISVSPTGVSGGNFGVLGFLTKSDDDVTNAIQPAERARAYTSLASVLTDWPTTSEVYQAATAFYGQTPTPRDFKVVMAYVTSQKATLTGGGALPYEELITTVTGAGVFNIDIEGVSVAISDLDFSADANNDEIAINLAAELVAAGAAGAGVSYGPYGFTITSGTSGAAATITPADGDAAEALGFAAYQSKASDGIDAETPVEALGVAEALGIYYIGLVVHKDYRDVLSGATGETTIEIASFAEAAKKIFCNTTNDLSTLNSALATDIGSLCKAATYAKTLTSFSKNTALYPSASVFGRAASVNFESIGSTITLNLKQMPGITAENLTPGEFGVLRSKYVSAVVQIGQSANAYTDSRMASGSWLDTQHGLMWLENRCETDLFNLLYQSATKVPFTQVGINTVKATLERSLEAAVRNGLAAPGFLPDGTFLPKGYIVEAVTLADVSSGDLGARLYQGLSFKMKGAGALHELVVAGTFAE